MLQAKSVPLALPSTTVGEVVRIDYDLCALRLTLLFDGLEPYRYLTFKDVCGFRVLDEGDLLEFWHSDNRPSGMVWEILAGGWFDQERQRSGFLSGSQQDLKEFMVLGQNDCMSVIVGKYQPLMVPPRTGSPQFGILEP